MDDFFVNIWHEEVIIPTYAIGKPEKNPMFFEKRVYQGSSGKVYPNPVIEKIYDEKTDKSYKGLFLENKYLKVMILPELGGRIQMAYDKIGERHFVYYNQVIKPALVGLTGPWISGGIEFNWPQHHRPSTFEQLDYRLETNADGSATIWINEVERMFHTKGMTGFTLYPDRAYIEIKAKLFNRSLLPQTFLWWANPAVKVNDHYQSVFPPDVNAVFDHGKRDVSTFPIATGTYYKVDYSAGVDISRYKNIPVPTSYMAINSNYDFVGGYEHDTQAGLLHVANHHVSPGKKQWTWGHSDFGQAWDRNLTDEDGPYIELMTGIFTDNQPDFTWLQPNEEKHFTQYFMPYRELGLIKNATKDILAALDYAAGIITLKVFVTANHEDLDIKLTHGGETLLHKKVSIVPEHIYQEQIPAADIREERVLLIVKSADGKEALRYDPASVPVKDIPQAAAAALMPDQIDNNEQLFLTGQHLEQYRHATYSPVPYYEEALRRDNRDIRNNNALGLWYLRRGQFAKSITYFEKAIQTATQRNPNPYDGECYYNLGVALKFLGRNTESYEAFYKATWSRAWQDSGFFSLAQLDLLNGDYPEALEHSKASLNNNANNGKAGVVLSAALRKLGKFKEAKDIVQKALELDAFNIGAIFELFCIEAALGDHLDSKAALVLSTQNEQTLMEYALDYAASGLYSEAASLLRYAVNHHKPSYPMVLYYLGYFAFQAGDQSQAKIMFDKAARSNSYLCFPDRLEDIGILELALTVNASDAKAAYYLGNLFYDKLQFDEAVSYWEQSAAADEHFPTVFRNLGIAYYNKSADSAKALDSFTRAFDLDTSDARVMMELDQLYKKLNSSPAERLNFIESYLEVAVQRDDLYLERIALHNFLGNYQTGYRLLMERQFHPWEGGEGRVSGQYVLALIEMAKQDLETGRYAEAIEKLRSAQTYPYNLGEGKLFGIQENDIFFWMGRAHSLMGQSQEARAYFEKASKGLEDPTAAIFYNDQQPDKIFYQGLARFQLGDKEGAERIFKKLVNYGVEHFNDEIKIDYFAVSLPNLLIFDDDLQLRNQIHCKFMQGLGVLGLEQFDLAKNNFLEVLELDAMHFGAAIHFVLADEKLNLITPLPNH